MAILNSYVKKTVNNFRKTLHLRCLPRVGNTSLVLTLVLSSVSVAGAG